MVVKHIGNMLPEITTSGTRFLCICQQHLRTNGNGTLV